MYIEITALCLDGHGGSLLLVFEEAERTSHKRYNADGVAGPCKILMASVDFLSTLPSCLQKSSEKKRVGRGGTRGPRVEEMTPGP